MGKILVEHGMKWRNGKLRDGRKCTKVARQVQDLLIRPWQMNTSDFPFPRCPTDFHGMDEGVPRVNCLHTPLRNRHPGHKTTAVNYYCMLKKSVINTEIVNDKTKIGCNVTEKE